MQHDQDTYAEEMRRTMPVSWNALTGVVVTVSGAFDIMADELKKIFDATPVHTGTLKHSYLGKTKTCRYGAIASFCRDCSTQRR